MPSCMILHDSLHGSVLTRNACVKPTDVNHHPVIIHCQLMTNSVSPPTSLSMAFQPFHHDICMISFRESDCPQTSFIYTCVYGQTLHICSWLDRISSSSNCLVRIFREFFSYLIAASNTRSKLYVY